MEKRKPHYELEEVKSVVRRFGINAFTVTARNGAALMGLNEVGAVSVVLGMGRNDFYKSMTTHADSRNWQDVYRVMTPTGKVAYVKVTSRDGAVVIQFKEE